MNYRRMGRLALLIGAAALMVLPAAWRTGITSGVCGELELVVNTGKCVPGVANGIVRHKSGKLLDLNSCATYKGRRGDEITHHTNSATSTADFDISRDYNWVDPNTGEEAIAVMFDDGTIVSDDAQGTHIDFIRAVKKFMLTHPDVYHTVVFFPNFNHAEGSFYINIKNGIRGIGVDIQDESATFGTHKLEGYVNLRNFTPYPDDFNARIPPDNNDSPMTLLSHETAHRWGALVKFDGDPSSRVKVSSQLLGRGLTHWCYFANVPAVMAATNSSSLEGNAWADLGTGSFTTTNAGGTGGYSDLDLYLMGLIPPSAVTPTFTIAEDRTVAQTCSDRPYTPEWNGPDPVTVIGERMNVTIESIAEVEGYRNPSEEASPKKFRVAFVLLSRNEPEVPLWHLEKLNRMRESWENYFIQQTAGIGEVVTPLGPVDMDGDTFDTVLDCNDTDPIINPNSVEECNFVDDDCDGLIDEGHDADGDLWTSCNGDCDDNNPAISPNALEVMGNLIDENCDGVPDNSVPVDQDFDGYSPPIDCDDLNADISPEGLEMVDEIDNNCNGFVDCQDPTVITQSEKGGRRADGFDNDCNDIIDG